MLQQFILPAISLGMSASIIPGPMQAYILNTTLTHGWRKGIILIFAPLIIDPPLILIVVFLLGQMPDAIIQLIRLAGGLLLFWIAWGSWQQYRQGVRLIPNEAPEATGVTSRQILSTGIMMNLLSPGPYLFWGTVNGPLLLQALDQSLIHAAAFLIAFYGTFLGGMSLLIFVLHRVRGFDERLTARIILLTIVLLVWFGCSLILEAFGIANTSLIAAIIVLLGGGLLFFRNRS